MKSIIRWLKSLFVSKDRENIDEIADKIGDVIQLEIKREMCKRALQSGVCPHACDICAWNTLK